MEEAATREAGGYLSAEHKRKFTMAAGVLGALFFVVQFALPMVAMLLVFPFSGFPGGDWMRRVRPRTSVLWKGDMWLLDRPAPVGNRPESVVKLKRLPARGSQPPEEVDEVPLSDAWLLPGGDRLWVVSTSGIAHTTGGKLRFETTPGGVAGVSLPFLDRGRPAVLERNPEGLWLTVFSDGRWQQQRQAGKPRPDEAHLNVEDRQVIPDDEGAHLFAKYGHTLFHCYASDRREPDAPREEWGVVATVHQGWHALRLADGPLVVYVDASSDRANGPIVGVRYTRGSWKRYFTYDATVARDVGGFSLEHGNKHVMVTQGFPGSFRVVEMDGPTVVNSVRHGHASPFPPSLLRLMFLPHILTMATPLILALILTVLMSRHRIQDYEAEGNRVRFASLTRRAVAQVIDVSIAGGPTAAGFFITMRGFFDMERMHMEGPFSPFAGLGLVFGGLAWGALCFVVYAYLEGRWGGSPGKWATGIRVVGTDLKPCGFGRALLRGFLKFVDGFFNFLVGVLIVAFSENWQRVGDMAARTLVIDVRRPSGKTGEG